MRRARRSVFGAQGGFTLVELLLAVAIMSVVFIALYATFFSVMGSRERIENELERTRQLRRFMDIITMEIRSSYYDSNNKVTLFNADMDVRRGSTMSSLAFTAFTYPVVGSSRAPSGDLVALKYFVGSRDKGADGIAPTDGILYKKRWNPYEGEDSAYKAEVMEGVESFSLSYFDGETWVKAWDAKRERATPMGVKIELKLRKGGSTSLFSSITRTALGRGK